MSRLQLVLLSSALICVCSSGALAGQVQQAPVKHHLTAAQEAEIKERIRQWNKAIERDPRRDSYYSARGYEYYKLGDYQSALRDYNEAIRINPSEGSYYASRCEAYNLLGNYQKALVEMDTAMSKGIQAPDAYRLRARLYGKLHQYDQAYADAQRAAELDHHSTESMVLLAESAGLLQRWDEAVRSCTQLLARNPSREQAIALYICRTDAYVHLGKRDLARHDYRAAQKLGHHWSVAEP